jgi:hypothetical protein
MTLFFHPDEILVATLGYLSALAPLGAPTR